MIDTWFKEDLARILEQHPVAVFIDEAEYPAEDDLNSQRKSRVAEDRRRNDHEALLGRARHRAGVGLSFLHDVLDRVH